MYKLACTRVPLLYIQYFSKNGLPTIVTKDPYWQTRIGQRERLSNSDLKLAMLVYNCGECVHLQYPNLSEFLIKVKPN